MSLVAEHSTVTTPRVLAERTADGIEVALIWWPEDDDRLAVSVLDGRLGTSFQLPVAAGDAMDAFRHPYAYAARAGVLAA